MKIKIHFLVLQLLLAFPILSQQVEISEIKTIDPKIKEDYSISAVSPNGKYLLVSKPLYSGLSLVTIKNGETRILSTMLGSGYQPAFSTGSRYVFYRTDDFTNKKRQSSIYKTKVSTADASLLVKNERVLSPPLIAGNNLVYTIDGSFKSKMVHQCIFNNIEDKNIVILKDLNPVLYSNGEMKVLNPEGEGSYIWVSMSPNKKMLLYYFVGKGTSICGLNGKKTKYLGNLRNPKWLGNNYIIGVESHTSDEKSTATDLVAYSVKTGIRLVITDTKDTNERNPIVYDRGRRIAYQTSGGALKVLKIRIK
jgi:hypothetical protein